MSNYSKLSQDELKKKREQLIKQRDTNIKSSNYSEEFVNQCSAEIKLIDEKIKN